MVARYLRVVCLVVTLTLLAIIGMLMLSGNDSAHALSSVLYVAPSGDCGGSTPCYNTVQQAVDAAQSGDEIRVAAGIYVGVNDHGGLSQALYVDKSLTIRGGYTISNWDTPDPDENSTEINALTQGRGMVIFGPDVNVMVAGLRLSYGNAHGLGGGSDAGGGLYVKDATVTLSHTWILSCTAGSGYGSVGGGAYIQDSTATIANSTIQGSSAQEAGGGLYLRDVQATLQSNTIQNNSVSSIVGTGIALYTKGGEAVLADNTIRYNEANSGNEAVYVDNGNAVVTDNVISDSTGWCGGFGSNGDAILLEGNTVQANSGMGIEIRGTGHFTLTSNTVDDNGSEGIWVFLLDGPSGALLQDNLIEWNNEGYEEEGAGVHLSSPAGWPIRLMGNTIQHNTCHSCNGGGVYIATGGVTLTNNLIQHNVVTDDPNPNITNGGGGIYVEGDATLINNIVTDNDASKRGAGIYIVGASPTLYHNTIANNIGDGGGVYVKERNSSTPAQPELYNTIIVSHTTGIYASGDALNTVLVDSVLWWGNSDNTGGAGTFFKFNEVAGNPVFANPAGDDYHIGASSTAIDNGVDTNIAFDIDSEPRFPGQVDLGADEYWAPGALKRIYLPLVVRSYQ